MSDYLWRIAQTPEAKNWLTQPHAHAWAIAVDHEHAVHPGVVICCALCGYIDRYVVTTDDVSRSHILGTRTA